MVLSRDQILKANDLETKEVEVPEWGGSVLVRGLTGAERDKFESEIADTKGKKVKMNLDNFRAKLVAKCTVDEDGKRIFTDEDVKELGNKSAAALQRIFNVAQELCGMSQEDVDELAGN